MSLKEEKDLVEQLRDNFPNMDVNYGDLQRVIVPANFSSSNPLDKETRAELMNSLVSKMIEVKDYLADQKTIDGAVYELTEKRILEQKDWDWSLSTELGEKEKDKFVEIPKLSVDDGENKYEVKLGYQYQRDKFKTEDDDEIVHVNIKNLEISMNGEKVNLEKVQNSELKRFFTTLNEGSIGDTVSYQKGEREDRDRVMAETLDRKFKEVASSFFLEVKTIDGFKPDVKTPTVESRTENKSEGSKLSRPRP
tara:strand:+ start:409 stop:1161 length:753 start_codon:yes stop_codon:yes gene_type:complete